MQPVRRRTWHSGFDMKLDLYFCLWHNAYQVFQVHSTGAGSSHKA